jgi:hypothetical protein
MLPGDDRFAGIADTAGLIIPRRIQELYVRLCREIIMLSDEIQIETSPFEMRFYDQGGFRVTVSPYRELFMVSVGSSFSCDVRVSAEDGYIAALDLLLHHYLKVRSECVAGT